MQGSFDLDNSDQLNDIIQKYENMLDENGEPSKVNGRLSGQKRNSNLSDKALDKEGGHLEESWG